MIRTFANKDTEKIWNQIYIKKMSRDLQKIALRKLFMIQRAKELNDLRIPPANMLEKLKGNRGGQYSIRINSQFRVCFYWKDSNAYEVEIVDYH